MDSRTEAGSGADSGPLRVEEAFLLFLLRFRERDAAALSAAYGRAAASSATSGELRHLRLPPGELSH